MISSAFTPTCTSFCANGQCQQHPSLLIPIRYYHRGCSSPILRCLVEGCSFQPMLRRPFRTVSLQLNTDSSPLTLRTLCAVSFARTYRIRNSRFGGRRRAASAPACTRSDSSRQTPQREGSSSTRLPRRREEAMHSVPPRAQFDEPPAARRPAPLQRPLGRRVAAAVGGGPSRAQRGSGRAAAPHP
jgi:hypothetical protein